MRLYTTRDEFKVDLLLHQLYYIGVVIVAGVGLLLIEYFWPDFFNYPYFSWEVKWEAIQLFWPLFVYCAIMACFILFFVNKERGRSSFMLGALTSFLAGLWEEIAYRCIFVCYAMIVIVWLNFLLSSVIGTVVGLALLSTPLFFFRPRDIVASAVSLLLMAVGVGVLYLVGFVGGDPVFWFYREITIPVINFITFGQFKEIFYNGYPELFLFGLVSANAWFRSGHEYQGLFGIVNSWIIGFVLMYAMLHYGLLTAIVLHILYDLQIDVIRFIFRR